MKDFLLHLAAVSAAQTLPRFRTQLSVDNKLAAEGQEAEASQFDPVTQADREAEKAIRKAIAERFAGDRILGEEFGVTNDGAANGWIIDPVDGTRAFISGVPLWGTLIGRHEGDCMVAGLMHQPFTGESYVATSQGAWLVRNGVETPLSTSDVTHLNRAKLLTTSPRIFSPDTQAPYDRLEAACRLPRYGCDCYAYALLAGGHIDLVAEAGLQTYDIAPLIPIIERAGGVVRTWDGGSAKDGGNVLAAANETLFEEAAKVLRG
ncbi:MAG: histidinol-phosphatase [Pseudomonadota bacterium]